MDQLINPVINSWKQNKKKTYFPVLFMSWPVYLFYNFLIRFQSVDCYFDW